VDLTQEHVPPRLLLRRTYPGKLLTVPSCLSCNRAFPKDEEYFRLMTVGAYCHTMPADELFDGPIVRSMDRKGFGEPIPWSPSPDHPHRPPRKPARAKGGTGQNWTMTSMARVSWLPRVPSL
jgi:hypothetical protein